MKRYELNKQRRHQRRMERRIAKIEIMAAPPMIVPNGTFPADMKMEPGVYETRPAYKPAPIEDYSTLHCGNYRGW